MGSDWEITSKNVIGKWVGSRKKGDKVLWETFWVRQVFSIWYAQVTVSVWIFDASFIVHWIIEHESGFLIALIVTHESGIKISLVDYNQHFKKEK